MIICIDLLPLLFIQDEDFCLNVVVVTAHFVIASTSTPIDQVSKTNSSITRHDLVPEGFNFEINLQSFDSLEEVSEESNERISSIVNETDKNVGKKPVHFPWNALDNVPWSIDC